jgi:hypothetical protein
MLAALDEPERLVLELIAIGSEASVRNPRRSAWEVVVNHLHRARLELDLLNR